MDHNNRPDHTSLLGLPDRELRLMAGEATHQHYKGGLYRLLGPCRDAMTGEALAYRANLEPVVIYEHCYPHERELWARSEREFNEEVEWAGGERRPRFRPLGTS